MLDEISGRNFSRHVLPVKAPEERKFTLSWAYNRRIYSTYFLSFTKKQELMGRTNPILSFDMTRAA
jgi:hypothetical protein